MEFLPFHSDPNLTPTIIIKSEIHHIKNMAAFFKHICLWPNCGRKCSSLKELIDHIEVIHIERDPIMLEKQEASQPAAIALSYVSCFFADRAAKMKKPDIGLQSSHHHHPHDVNSHKKNPGLKLSRKHQTDEMEFEDEIGSVSDADSEDSSNSWSTNASSCQDGEEYRGEGTKRRFVCPVQGCGKRYKNINGIKYHAKNGHNRKAEMKQKLAKAKHSIVTTADGLKHGYKCHCGKVYKSQSGLRHHQNTHHGKKLNVSNKDQTQEHLHKKQLLGQVKLPRLNMYTAVPTKSSNSMS
eukprot:gene3637-4153_t